MAAHKDFDLASLGDLEPPISDFTKVQHQKTYPTIDPSRAELSKAGQVVLITGGGTNIGKAIATAYTTAHAKTVIIASRNKAVLDATAEELQKYAASIKSPTQIVVRTVDYSKDEEIVGLWDALAAENITVDILVLNAALFAEAKLLHNLGIERLWKEFEVNVKGPLYFAEKFQKQKGFLDSPKALINVTTGAMHMLDNPLVSSRPSYPLTKASATFAVSQIADAYKPEQLQVLSYHPGMLYGEGWKAFGITEDMLPFDTLDLPGSFAVWAASKDAHFLHGRYVAANWDVDELNSGETKKHLEDNPDYLRLAVTGLRGVKRAY
ncbi:hypothetical protein SBRCBS47491_009180 [Sporothrix bragantina]|uniref:NAD(P)-binding protein n=1 Tax=Sporothrix bragantina TaxID=671064 RepID=A0ABP0CTI1_9PEZI